MKEISIEELKSLQLDILVKVAEFCENNDLKYFLAYGTLIGAVRHKGYIPWDDDIDIIMPRKDYDKLLASFNGKVQNLEIDAPEIHLDYYAPYANVFENRTILVEEYLSHGKREIGVKIDIFPLDNLPSDKKLWPKIYEKSIKHNSIFGIKNGRLGFYHGLMKIKLLVKKMIYLPIPFKTTQKRHLKLLRESNLLSGGEYSDVIAFPVDGIKPFENKNLYPLTNIEFENHIFRAPKAYDEYLRNIYGDYMQLPPVEKRVAHHHFRAYWK